MSRDKVEEKIELTKAEYDELIAKIKRLEEELENKSKQEIEFQRADIRFFTEVIRDIAEQMGITPKEVLEVLKKPWTRAYCLTVPAEIFAKSRIRSFCQLEEKLREAAAELNVSFEELIARIQSEV